MRGFQEHPSEGKPFKSRFGGGYIAAAPYLAEGMCDRQARSKKTELPHRFWKDDPWKHHFMLQLRHANSLLKLYSAEAIMRALRTPEGKRIFSLGAKWLDPLVQEQQKKWEREQEKLREQQAKEPPPAEPAQQPAIEKPRPVFVEKQSALSKLRGLD